MIVRIDTDSPVPPYRQLVDQVLRMVSSARLPVGQRLPTVRQLAGDLGLANGTVARAYRLLEEAGVVETRGRRGTFVARQPPEMSSQERVEYLRGKTAALIEAAALVGASETEIKRTLDELLAEEPTPG